MMHLLKIAVASIFYTGYIIIFTSCGKGGGGGTTDPCAGITVSVSANPTNPTTIGGTNGSISASASGASGFTYSVNSGSFQTSGIFSNLSAGSYTITAKSAAGCTGSITVTLSNPPNPCSGVTIGVTATLVNPTSVGGVNGSINANASGSTGFTYNINGGPFQSSPLFSSLAAGNYTIIAKDINGCTGSSVFTLVDPNPCAGITITVTGTTVNPSTVGGNNGSISASASGSTGFTYNINGGSFQTTGNFISLQAGNYTIMAKDVNGCTGSAVFTLTNPNPCAGVSITVNGTATSNTPCTSNSATITLSALGGVAPYTFSLNSGAYQSSNVFSNLATAVYTVNAKDVNGCIGSNTTAVSNLAAGPLFSQVKTLIQTNCAVSGCHNGTQSPNFTVDCNIVANNSLIQQRAVNAIPSAMPPSGLLSSTERQKITNWINAGGRYSD